MYELTSSGVTHLGDCGGGGTQPPRAAGDCAAYSLVDIDFAARILALRDVHSRSVHQHVIAFDELGVV